MQVFHIKGISGLLAFLAALFLVMILVAVLPASLMMTLWNATVFEGLKGPEVTLAQGFVLWMILLVVGKLVFHPQIEFQFRQAKEPADLDHLNKDE